MKDTAALVGGSIMLCPKGEKQVISRGIDYLNSVFDLFDLNNLVRRTMMQHRLGMTWMSGCR